MADVSPLRSRPRAIAALIVVAAAAPLIAPRAAAVAPTGFTVLGDQIPVALPPIPGGWSEVLPQTNTTMPTLTPGEIAQGYVTFSQSTLDRIYPGTAPIRDDITTTVQMSSAIGGYEAGTFSVRALQPMNGVSAVLAGDLLGPGGATIPADHVDIRSVTNMPRWVSSGQYTVTPSVLEKKPSLTVSAGTSQRFWMTVKTPDGATPGTYTGSVNLQVQGLPDTAMQVQMEVLPFELMDSPTRQGMYYNAVDVTNPAYPALPDAQVTNDVLNMAERGMNTMFISIHEPMGAPVGGVYDTSGSVDHLVNTYEAAGMNRVIWNTTQDDLLNGSFGPNVAAFNSTFAANGWSAPILSAGDEGDANGSGPAVGNWLNQINNNAPGSDTYSTIVFPENGDFYEGNDLDIRAISSYADDSVIAPAQAAGRELWIYSGPSGWGIAPVGDRLYRGLWAVAMELDGVMDWRYYGPIDPTEPYNDLVLSNRNNLTQWVFEGDTGPLPTPGWEAMREGIEDERYVFTLRQLITAAQNSGNPNKIAIAQAATTFLDGVLAELDTSPRADDSVFPVKREAEKLEQSGSVTALPGSPTLVAHWDGGTVQNGLTQDLPTYATTGIRAGGIQGPGAIEPSLTSNGAQPGFGTALDMPGDKSFFLYADQTGPETDLSTIGRQEKGTLELWVAPDGAAGGVVPGEHHVLAMFGPGTGGSPFGADKAGIFITNNPPTGRSTVWFNWFGEELEDPAGDTLTWAADEWHHVAFTWDSGVIGNLTDGLVSLFVDGVLIESATMGAKEPAATGLGEVLWIGGSSTGTSFFDGLLDELIVHDDVVYLADFTPSGPGSGAGSYFDGFRSGAAGFIIALSQLPGDANNDGVVTADDLIAVQQNFGNVGPVDGLLLGDANDDGTVTADDLVSVQQNFGNALGGVGAAVPEPGTAALLLMALAVLRRRGCTHA